MTPVKMAELRRRVEAAGLNGGLASVGFAPATPFHDTRVHLEQRKTAGFHGGMNFTYRNPARSTDPARILHGARSLVVGAYGYRQSSAPKAPAGAMGRVARYAWRDHYADLRAGLQDVADVLTAEGFRAVVVADDNALVDRAAAARAGLGWFGKNANLLLPRHGSWFVLGSVVTDADLGSSATSPLEGCGTCTRCIDACPTGAIVAPGVVDARRCLAWLLQAPGDFPVEFRDALGDRIYGCDDCQEVCPPNRAAERRAPVDVHDRDEVWVPLVRLLDSSDPELLDHHGRWYIAERDPRYLRRNALVALGNTADARDPHVQRVLTSYLRSDDEMLRRHALWAAQKLGLHDLTDRRNLAGRDRAAVTSAG